MRSRTKSSTGCETPPGVCVAAALFGIFATVQVAQCTGVFHLRIHQLTLPPSAGCGPSSLRRDPPPMEISNGLVGLSRSEQPASLVQPPPAASEASQHNVVPLGPTGVVPINPTGVVPLTPTGVVPLTPTGVVPLAPPTGVVPLSPSSVLPLTPAGVPLATQAAAASATGSPHVAPPYAACQTYIRACLTRPGSKSCQLGSFVSGVLTNNSLDGASSGGSSLVTQFTFDQPWPTRFELSVESWLVSNGSDWWTAAGNGGGGGGGVSETFGQRSMRVGRRRRPVVDSLRHALLAGLEWAARTIFTLPDRFAIGKRRSDHSPLMLSSRTVDERRRGGTLLSRFVVRRSLAVDTSAVPASATPKTPTTTTAATTNTATASTTTTTAAAATVGAAAVDAERMGVAGGGVPLRYEEWRAEAANGARLVADYRVACADGFTGATCTEVCPHPGDADARFNCTEGGRKRCLDGWRGGDCGRPVCAPGCSEEHGGCTRPGECRCRLGWTGHDCTRCARLPGCVHGTCETALECNCQPGWTGIFCHRPICKKECHPTRGFCDKPDTCSCRFGWKGSNCEECKPLPGCLNGHCTKPLECICQPGWTGLFCHIRKSICTVDCDPEHGFCEKPDECRCRVGWTGPRCDRCVPYPGCVHGSCTDQPWQCECRPGWTGPLCDIAVPTEPAVNLTALAEISDVVEGSTEKSLPCLEDSDNPSSRCVVNASDVSLPPENRGDTNSSLVYSESGHSV